MEPYLFFGVVLPERAELSIQRQLKFTHVGSGISGAAKLSIIRNQAAIWIDTENEWNVFDLRNVVKNMVQTELAILGFASGLAYDFEVTRVVNRERSIDVVFGIDIPVLAQRKREGAFADAISTLRAQVEGPNGVLVQRCLADLLSAMKNADDTGFYCYRAIESLRHHCAAKHDLSNAEKAAQWQKFREVAGVSEETVRSIKAAADPLRHGQVAGVDNEQRATLFTRTWDVVEGYFRGASLLRQVTPVVEA